MGWTNQSAVSAGDWWTMERLERSLDDCVGILVFPHSQHGPARGLQCRVAAAIALNVSAQLRGPVDGICARIAGMEWASVPEAAVDKNA